VLSDQLHNSQQPKASDHGLKSVGPSSPPTLNLYEVIFRLDEWKVSLTLEEENEQKCRTHARAKFSSTFTRHPREPQVRLLKRAINKCFVVKTTTHNLKTGEISTHTCKPLKSRKAAENKARDLRGCVSNDKGLLSRTEAEVIEVPR
jgi:hypothetical protein